MGCGASHLVPCPGSNCTKDGTTITAPSPSTTPTPSCICCKTQKCEKRKAKKHTPRTNRSAELRKKAIEAKLNKNVKPNVHPRTSKPKISQKSSTPTTPPKHATMGKNTHTPSSLEESLNKSTQLVLGMTSTQDISVMDPVTAVTAVPLIQKSPTGETVAVEPAVVLTQELSSCESVEVEPAVALTQELCPCETVAEEPAVALTQELHVCSCENVEVEPAVVLTQEVCPCENIAEEPAVVLTQEVHLCPCENVAVEPAVALTQELCPCENAAEEPAVALTQDLHVCLCETVAVEPAVALTQEVRPCENVEVEPEVVLTQEVRPCENVAVEPAVVLTQDLCPCETVAVEPAVALTQALCPCETVAVEPAVALTQELCPCETVAVEPAVAFTKDLSSCEIVTAEPAVAFTQESSSYDLLEIVSCQDVYILEPIQTVIKTPSTQEDSFVNLVPAGIDRHSQDISVMDPVLAGNRTPLSQEASGVDIVSAGSILSDEESSLSIEELDVFIANILHSQVDVVQKNPSPPTTPKPLVRRTPRVRSPTTETSSDEAVSCVQTPTVTTEEDIAQLPNSSNSSKEGSSVDLEIVGSKYRLTSAPSSPEKPNKSKSVRDTTKKLTQKPQTRSQTSRTVQQVSQKSKQPSRQQSPTKKLRKESVESFTMDDGSPQVKKPSSRNNQPKRPQRGKSDTKVPCDSGQTKAGVKVEQGGSWTSSDSRKSRRSPEPPQADAVCKNQIQNGSSKFLDADQAKSKTASDVKTSSRKLKPSHESDKRSNKATSSLDADSPRGEHATPKPSSATKKSSAYAEIPQARTKENMSIVGKNAKKSSQVDAQRYSRRDKHASTKHSSTSTDSKKTSGYAEQPQAKAKEGMRDSPVVGKNARKGSSVLNTNEEQQKATIHKPLSGKLQKAAPDKKRLSYAEVAREGIRDSPVVGKNARKGSSVDANSRRDKHASSQHSSTSSDTSSGYLEPSRANAMVDSKGSGVKKKKDVNPIHSNTDNNTAVTAKERSHSLQNSEHTFTGSCNSPVFRKRHKEAPSTESSSGRNKKTVDNRPQSNANTFSANKVKSVNETQEGTSSKASIVGVSLKDSNERFSDIKSFSRLPSAKSELSGSRRSLSASIERMDERSQSSRSSRSSPTQLDASDSLKRSPDSRKRISPMERTDKRASSARCPRVSPTQFEVLDSSKTFTFASPSYPELRSRTSRSESSLNKLEVLNTSDEQQKATLPEPPSGKLQKAAPNKKRLSYAEVAKEDMLDSTVVGKNVRKGSSVDAHSSRDKHASNQHSSTSSDTKHSLGYLEPSRANTMVDSKGSRKAGVKKKKDVNPIHSNTDNNTALTAKERSHSLQNIEQTLTGPCLNKLEVLNTSTEQQKATSPKPPSGKLQKAAPNKERLSYAEVAKEGMLDSTVVGKNARKGSSVDAHSGRDKHASNQHPSTSSDTKHSSGYLEPSRANTMVDSKGSRKAGVKTKKDTNPIPSNTDNNTAVTAKERSHSLQNTEHTLPGPCLNKLEVLNTSDEQQKATSPNKPPSGKLQKAAPNKKRLSYAEVAKSL